MNKHLQLRVEALFNAHDTATLATCGPAGPQISIVTYSVKQLRLHLTLTHGSDHLFNLETEPSLVLMTAGWRLHGHRHAISDTNHQQATVIVIGTRLHILSDDGQNTIETIDF